MASFKVNCHMCLEFLTYFLWPVIAMLKYDTTDYGWASSCAYLVIYTFCFILYTIHTELCMVLSCLLQVCRMFGLFFRCMQVVLCNRKHCQFWCFRSSVVEWCHITISHEIVWAAVPLMIAWDIKLHIWLLFGEQRNMEHHYLKVHKMLPICFSSFNQRIYFLLCNGRL